MRRTRLAVLVVLCSSLLAACTGPRSPCAEGDLGCDTGGPASSGDAGSADAGFEGTADGGGNGVPDAGVLDAGAEVDGEVATDAGAAFDGGSGGDAGFPPRTWGVEFAVAPEGDDSSAGTLAAPFATLERAREALRAVVQSGGLPDGGARIWLRGGVYERTATFELTLDDSGGETSPVVWAAYPGETPRLVGGKRLEPGWFSPVDAGSPVWSRLDPSARGQVLEMDLFGHGITDAGTLKTRGFSPTQPAALELFSDGVPMTLARWPDPAENDPEPTPTDAQLVLYGTASPDVTGTYLANGTRDGVNLYQRQGLVEGKQYRLYRHTWVYQGQTYTAWFLTTTPSGYPSPQDPWWYRYDRQFGAMSPSNAAVGSPTTENPSALLQGFARIDSALSDTRFTYAGDRPSRWVSAPEPWLHGYWMYPWADLHVAAAAIDLPSRTVTLFAKPGYGIASGQPFYAENLLEELTLPGEWYLERSSGRLYFWPPRPIAQSEVQVSLLESPLVRLRGASHVVLDGLRLEAGRGELVRIEGGAHNRLLNCQLWNAGTDAAVIGGSDNGLERCEVAYPGDRGVRLEGGARASLTPGGNFVTHSHLHHFGRWSWTYRPGIELSGVGQRVENNLIESAPHTAVLFTGNEHQIARNEIRRVCQFTSDAGAIYAGRDWGYRGNQIRHNFIHDIDSAFRGYGVHGVYLDDCVSGISVVGNVLYRISGYGIFAGGGRDNLLENNVIARCGGGLHADSRGLTSINNTPADSWNFLERLHRDGIQYRSGVWASTYPKLAAIPDSWAEVSDPTQDWRYPQGSVFSRNLGFANLSWVVEAAPTGVLDKFAEVVDNLPDQDPLFLDEPSLDLTLGPGSPAFALPGFQPIPFGDIGLRP